MKYGVFVLVVLVFLFQSGCDMVEPIDSKREQFSSAELDRSFWDDYVSRCGLSRSVEDRRMVYMAGLVQDHLLRHSPEGKCHPDVLGMVLFGMEEVYLEDLSEMRWLGDDLTPETGEEELVLASGERESDKCYLLLFSRIRSFTSMAYWGDYWPISGEEGLVPFAVDGGGSVYFVDIATSEVYLIGIGTSLGGFGKHDPKKSKWRDRYLSMSRDARLKKVSLEYYRSVREFVDHLSAPKGNGRFKSEMQQRRTKQANNVTGN